MTLKIAVFAPIPRPNVRTATAAKPGADRSRRTTLSRLLNI
jgi:hypothetical protein